MSPVEKQGTTGQGQLPPGDETPASGCSKAYLGLTSRAATGEFALQVCNRCSSVQYPPREACGNCLSVELIWTKQTGRGRLIAATQVCHSTHPYFRTDTPWIVGMVRLDVGVTVIAHVHRDCADTRGPVLVRALMDRSGRGVLAAFSPEGNSMNSTDPHMREMNCSPEGRAILVTDATSETAVQLIRLLTTAGARKIWAGNPNGIAARTAPLGPGVESVPLDLTDSASISRLAEEVGAELQIVINTANSGLQACGAADSTIDRARSEMERNYLSLLRLADALVPPMIARANVPQLRPVAWVNILSVYALTNFAPLSAFCASQAATLSHSHSLRPRLQAAGIRMLNVFPGPVDGTSDLAVPRLAPKALAGTIIAALNSGLEDCYPGDFAQSIHARWSRDPKVLELEMRASALSAK